MKKRLLILTLALLLVCLALASCGGDKKIERLTLTGGLKYKYELNETPDFSKVTATVTYNDGTSEELTGDKLTFSTLDTATVGKKQLTVTYQDYTLTIEVEVLGKSLDFSDVDEIGGTILGTELPAWYQVAQNQRAWSKFQIKDSTYKVGDANPFAFRLQLDILDANLEEVDYTGAYTSVSTVHLVNGTELSLAGTEYVTVDEANNTFQFTAAAVGKIFKISTRPLYGVETEDEAAFTRSIIVEIVSGYNVTDAKELNLMTNCVDTFLGHSIDQVQMAKDFINNQYGPNYYETYGGHYLKGIVLHRNLTPTIHDIPADYLYTYPANHATMPGGKAFHNGNFNVYYHQMTAISPTFGFYGNYFQVKCTQMPDACDETVADYGKDISNDKLFAFVVDEELFNTEAEFNSYDYSQYTALIENISFFGNDASTNDAGQNREHKLALAALNFQYSTTTLRNIAVEAFNLSVVVQNDNQAVSIDKCFFNNAWQGHIYCWVNNAIQEYLPGDHYDVLPLAGHQPIRINITNSTITKCGGPVIMAQIETDAGVIENYNKNSALHVTVDAASTLWAYANGTEAWFEAYNMTGPASDLMALNYPVSGYGTALGKPSAFTSTETAEGTLEHPKANLIFLSMSPNDTFTVDGKCVYNGNNDMVNLHFTQGAGTQGAPLLESSNGGYAVSKGSAELYAIDANTLIEESGENCDKFFSGSHIIVHVAIQNPGTNTMMRTGILMEYLH